MTREQILQAVARGWCYPENSAKVMDTDLAEAICNEVEGLFRDYNEPQLGCATTRELFDEIIARGNFDMDYRTIDSD